MNSDLGKYNNSDLGNYNMVLALSSDKINYQFKQMYKHGIIHKDWFFVTNSMGQEVKPLTLEKSKKYWEYTKKIKSIQQKIMDELKKDQFDVDNIKKLKNDLTQLQTDLSGVLEGEKVDVDKYDLGLIATISPPEIDILEQNTQELLFQISFEPDSDSKLYYIHEGTMCEYNLGENKIKYAFRVKIGQVRTTSDQEILEITGGKPTSKQLGEKGINDNDFTIQSLFLNFENANIASYDSTCSTLPDNSVVTQSLQTALTNYFSDLAKSHDSPYILGYGIEKKEVQAGERALFYPSGVAYSTSYSNEKKASTFNFLMMLNNQDFPPRHGQTGVLPKSLMEQAQDKTPTVNGVLGLDIGEFEDNYIPFLSNELVQELEASLKSKFTKPTCDKRGKDVSLEFWWVETGVGTKKNEALVCMEIKYKGIKTNSNNNGVDIEYNISSNGDLYFFEKEWEWRCSTKEVGILLVNLNAGTNGRLELKINYEKPLKLGFDTEKPILTSSHPGLEIVFDFLLGYQIWTEFVMDVVNIMNNIQAITNVKLNELENKVILPISTVYTYKNVRISDDKTVLLFDTSYGTVAQ